MNNNASTKEMNRHGIKESGYQQYAKSPQSTATAPVQYTVGNGTPDDIAKYYTNALPVKFRDHLVGNGTPNDIAKVPSNFYTIGIGVEGLQRDVHPHLLYQDVERSHNIQRNEASSRLSASQFLLYQNVIDEIKLRSIQKEKAYLVKQQIKSSGIELGSHLRGGKRKHNIFQHNISHSIYRCNQVADNTNTIQLISTINDRVEEKRILYNKAFLRRDYLAAAQHQDGINMLEKAKSRLEAIINNNNKQLHTAITSKHQNNAAAQSGIQEDVKNVHPPTPVVHRPPVVSKEDEYAPFVTGTTDDLNRLYPEEDELVTTKSDLKQGRPKATTTECRSDLQLQHSISYLQHQNAKISKLMLFISKSMSKEEVEVVLKRIAKNETNSNNTNNKRKKLVEVCPEAERQEVELRAKEAKLSATTVVEDSETFGLPTNEFVSFIDNLVVRLVPGRFQTKEKFSDWLSDRKSEWKLMRNNKRRKIVPRVLEESRTALVPGRYQPKKLFDKWLYDRKIDWAVSLCNKKRKIIPRALEESCTTLVPGRYQPKEIFNKWLHDRKIDWAVSLCNKKRKIVPRALEESCTTLDDQNTYPIEKEGKQIGTMVVTGSCEYALLDLRGGAGSPGAFNPMLEEMAHQQQDQQNPMADEMAQQQLQAHNPAPDEGPVETDENGHFIVPTGGGRIFSTTAERVFNRGTADVPIPITLTSTIDKKRFVITGTFPEVNGRDDAARHNVLKNALESAGAIVTKKVNNLTDYLLVGNSPSVHALQAARSMHIAFDDYDPADATTTPLHQCKIVTLVRLQNVLSGQTSLQAFNSLPVLTVGMFMANASRLAFRVSYEERDDRLVKVRRDYEGKRLCENETCTTLAGRPYKKWGHKCASCYKTENNTLSHEKIILQQLHDLGLNELKVNSEMYATGEETSVYRYDLFSPDIASERVIIIFEIDGSAHHFNEECTDVPRAMETFEFAKSIAGNKPVILYRFFGGSGPEPLSVIAKCIKDVWENREVNHLPNLEMLESDEARAAAVEIQDKVILVGMPEIALRRHEEYVSVFGKERVESKEYAYQDRQYSGLDDDDRIEKIDLDQLDECRKIFGKYGPDVNNRGREYESSFFNFHQNNRFDPRFLGASITPDVNGLDNNTPLLDTYNDVIENNKPAKWHRVKVIRRLQRLIQRFVRENTRLHFKVKAITYEMYTMDDHQFIEKMEDLKRYTDGDGLNELELFPADDVLYIENALKLLRGDITLDDITYDGLKEKLTLFLEANSTNN